MTTYKDTAQDSSDLKQNASFNFQFGGSADVDFYLTLYNYIIGGQSTGQNVVFSVHSRDTGMSLVVAEYGQIVSQKCRGYLVTATAAASPNCDVRVVCSSEAHEPIIQRVYNTPL